MKPFFHSIGVLPQFRDVYRATYVTEHLLQRKILCTIKGAGRFINLR